MAAGAAGPLSAGSVRVDRWGSRVLEPEALKASSKEDKGAATLAPGPDGGAQAAAAAPRTDSG